MRTASITNGIVSWGSGTTRRATSRAVRTGFASTGPLASVNSTGTPIASTGIRMSEKRIAASTPSCSTGSRVTCVASSGFLHSSMKVCFLRIARYSGW